MISKSFLIMLFTFFMSIPFPANSDLFDLSFESIDGNIISLKEFKNTLKSPSGEPAVGSGNFAVKK